MDRMNERVVVPERLEWTNTEGEMVLLDIEQGQFYGLDEIGSRIWEGIVAQKTIGEIVAVLMKEYDVEPECLQQDVLVLIDSLAQKHLVVLETS